MKCPHGYERKNCGLCATSPYYKWIPSAKRLPDEGQTVVIWDADWCEPFLKTMRPSLHWDMRRFTHWYPLPEKTPA